MPLPPAADHRVVAADPLPPPAPFRSFAVRSEEARHAHVARAPWAQVHVVRTRLLGAAATARLVALGLGRMQVAEAGDVGYAPVTLAELAATIGHAGLVGGLGDAVHATGVLGDDGAACRAAVAARIDFLAARGAGFHNDVRDHWTACLFWNLVLAAGDVEFVLPHAGVRLPLAPGDLVVFDPALAHGLCRPHDDGRFEPASFETGRADDRQVFLSGELPLADARWAALGGPWEPLEAHARHAALDLLVAEFDDRGGAVKRPRSLAHRMQRDDGPT